MQGALPVYVHVDDPLRSRVDLLETRFRRITTLVVESMDSDDFGGETSSGLLGEMGVSDTDKETLKMAMSGANEVVKVSACRYYL